MENIEKNIEETKVESGPQDLVFDEESGSMITKEEHERKMKEHLEDPTAWRDEK
jgi:thiamine phosphate synthase YjbQ (UPF0047 family)